MSCRKTELHFNLSATTYLINELTTNRANYDDILDKFDFYIVPLLNPDGIHFSQLRPEDGGRRYWRKNRRKNEGNSAGKPECDGVDLNRNFDFQWDGKASNPNICGTNYRGASGFSEPETQAVRDFIMKGKSDGVKWNVFVSKQ